MKLTIGKRLAIGFTSALIMLLVVTTYALMVSQRSLEQAVSKNSEHLSEALLLDIKKAVFYTVEAMKLEVRQEYIQSALSGKSVGLIKKPVKSEPGGSASLKTRPQSTIITPSRNNSAANNQLLSQQLEERFFKYYEKTLGYRLIRYLRFLDRQGAEILTVGNTGDFRKVSNTHRRIAETEGFHIGEVRYNQERGTGILPLIITVRNNKDTLLGYLHLGMFASHFFHIAQLDIPKYKSTRIHLLSKSGKKLHSTQAFKFMEDLSKTEIFLNIKSNQGSFKSLKGNRIKLFSYIRTQGNTPENQLDWILLIENDEGEVLAPISDLRNQILLALVIVILFFGFMSFFISRSIVRPILKLNRGVSIIGRGNLDYSLETTSRDEIGDLSLAFNKMAINLKQVDQKLRQKQRTLEDENQIKTLQTELNNKMQGELNPIHLAEIIINYLAEFLDAQTGAVYLLNDQNELKLTAGYAYWKLSQNDHCLKMGEGIIGQAAVEGKTLSIVDIEEEFLVVDAGIVKIVPRNFLACPILFQGKVSGVVFLGAVKSFSPFKKRILKTVLENIGVTINSSLARIRLQELLEETQAQSEELQEQQEALRIVNEELEGQTQALRQSESELQSQQEELRQSNEELQIQQEELRQANEELEEKSEALKSQKHEVVSKNQELEKVGKKLKQQSLELETSNRYKSEFLANMSHELRTPLNGLLIFAQLLYENNQGNLTDKQVKFAKDIHSCGIELLHLINDILDLSKIEAGKMELKLNLVHFADLVEYLNHTLKPLADKKQLGFEVKLVEDFPKALTTDHQRLIQILKNLVSNGIKFTDQGKVKVNFFLPESLPEPLNLKQGKFVAISVSDTGIGISEDDQMMVFEAFQQVDGKTDRQFGGTGLGLSISRELANILGGEIFLQSSPDQGSTFTLFLPLESKQESPKEIVPVEVIGENPQPSVIPEQPVVKQDPAVSLSESENHPGQADEESPGWDDRNSLDSSDKTILIIDDDRRFAELLLDLTRKSGFKGLVTNNGIRGYGLAEEYEPDAIILDINLPGMTGWEVMQRLKSNPKTQAIPVHFLSVLDKKKVSLKMGAMGFLSKPVSVDELNQVFAKISHLINKTVNHILIVEVHRDKRESLNAVFKNKRDITLHYAADASEASKILNSSSIDLMILDLSLPSLSGMDILQKLEPEVTGSMPPIVVYTGNHITQKEEVELRKHVESIIIKGENSPDRLLDEVELFLHRVKKDLAPEKKNMLDLLNNHDEVLNGKTVLLVDDDMRNVYALMNILEEYGLTVKVSTNGKEALETLNAENDINLVLMDMMMPEMDGYECIQIIRKQNRWEKLPVIALTAKAMKGDREKCIDAGANDYLSKPIDTNKLFSLLRVWLYE